MSEKPTSNSDNNSSVNNNDHDDLNRMNKFGQKQFILDKPINTVFNNSQGMTPEQQERLKMIDPQKAMMFYFATSTFFTRLFAHPLDRVSTILRTQHVIPKAYGASFYTTTTALESMGSSSYENVVASQKQAPFRGAIDALRKLPKDRTLWRGLAPDVYGRLCARVVQLQFAEEINSFVKPWLGSQNLVEQDPNNPTKKLLNTKVLATSAMSGALAGVTAFFLSYPFSVISARMQANLIPLHEVKYNMDWKMVNSTHFSNVWQSAKSIAQFEGLRGFYTGLSASVSGMAINRGIQFVLFDTLVRLGMSDRHSVREKFLISQACIFTASLATYPFRLISDRLKAQAVFRKLYSEEETQLFYRGTLDAIKKVYQQEGIRGYYRGYLFSLGTGYAGALFLSVAVATGFLSQYGL